MNETRRTTEQIRQRVRAQGWDVVSVPAQAGIPPHSYTAGLALGGLHEFIVFGFSPELARPVLSDLAQRLRDGERFPTNVGLEDVLPGMPVVLLEVPQVEADHYLAACPRLRADEAACVADRVARRARPLPVAGRL